jgi:hypothetical protein
VNESNMEHAQEAIKEFHNRPAKKQKKHKTWWGHHLSFSGARSYTNVPHQVVSEIKVKKLLRNCITNIMSITKIVVKWHGQMELSYVSLNQNWTPTWALRETLALKEEASKVSLRGRVYAQSASWRVGW